MFASVIPELKTFVLIIVMLFGNFIKSKKVSLHQLNSSFVIKDYLKVLKLFPDACHYGWKRMEI